MCIRDSTITGLLLKAAPVIVRMSDFKSNEYANLIGGKQFEPKEENPMLGFRGAGRYVSEAFKDCFQLECEAFKKVRNEMGLKNIQLMIPFIRTLKEAKDVINLLEVNGLKRGDEVITSGGIIGTVDRVMEDDRIEVLISNDIKVQVIKSTITSLLKKEEIKK